MKYKDIFQKSSQSLTLYVKYFGRGVDEIIETCHEKDQCHFYNQ